MSDTDLVTQAEALPADTRPWPPTAAENMMAIISKAAADPNTDVDKFERLVAMAERMQAQEAKAAFASALAELQPLLPVVTERGGIKDRNDKVQSTYALWEDINEAIRPHLAAHGFALSFRVGDTDGRITVTGILSHRGGHSEETTISLPVDTSGNKNAVQAVGSSTSYGKRYTAMALLNITSRGEDDDGKAAGQGQLVSDEQVTKLRAKIVETGSSLEKFLAYAKVERLEDMLASSFDSAIAMLEAKKRQAAKAGA